MDKEQQEETAQTAKLINEQIREALREARQAYSTLPTTPETDDSKETSKTVAPQPTTDNEEPAWFRKYREEQEQRYQQLRADNDSMKAEKQREEHEAQVASTAQRIGIPKYLLTHLRIDPETDIEQQLSHLKQELVNHSLLPADAMREQDSTHTLIESDADAWAKAL